MTVPFTCDMIDNDNVNPKFFDTLYIVKPKDFALKCKSSINNQWSTHG